MARCCLPCVPALAVGSRGLQRTCSSTAAAPAAGPAAAAAAAAGVSSWWCFPPGRCCCSKGSLVLAPACRATVVGLCSRSNCSSRSSSGPRTYSSSTDGSSSSSSSSSSNTHSPGVAGVALHRSMSSRCSSTSAGLVRTKSDPCETNRGRRCIDTAIGSSGCTYLSSSSSSTSSSSSSCGSRSWESSSRWGPFFGRQREAEGPSHWRLALDVEGVQPLFVTSSVAAAAAAAAAATTAPTASVRQQHASSGSLSVSSRPWVRQQQLQLLLLQRQQQQQQQTAGFSQAAEAAVLSPPLSEGHLRGTVTLAAAAAQQQQQQHEHEHEMDFAVRPLQHEQDEQQGRVTVSGSNTHHGGEQQQQQEARNQQQDPSYMSWKEVWHVFGIAALPMVGFGLMDQLIMIRLGDLLDTTLGVKFGLATLSAAAVGQLCSDTAGVLFGSTIESCASRLGFPSPNLSAAQRASAVFSLTKTLGAASGVCCGCLLGMLQLLVLDLDRADRLKHQQQLDTILETVLVDGPKLFHCERVVVGGVGNVHPALCFRGTRGFDVFHPVALTAPAPASSAAAAAVSDAHAIAAAAPSRAAAAAADALPAAAATAGADPRFNPEFDEKGEQKTRSVLAAPVMSASGDVIAALVFFNKHPQFQGRFSEYHAAGISSERSSLPAAAASLRGVAAAAASSGSSSNSRSSRNSRGLRGEEEALRGAQTAAAQEAILDQQNPCSSCSNCSSGIACVLLHSLGPSVAEPSLSGDRGAPASASAAAAAAAGAGPGSSWRRSLLTAAIAAATAAGMDTAAADGSAAWWLRWLFCLHDDDELMLLPESAAVGTSCEGERGDSSSQSTGETGENDSGGGGAGGDEAFEAKDEGPIKGGGDTSKAKRVARPPPYWKATFPHLYGSNRPSAARIVEGGNPDVVEAPSSGLIASDVSVHALLLLTASSEAVDIHHTSSPRAVAAAPPSCRVSVCLYWHYLRSASAALAVSSQQRQLNQSRHACISVAVRPSLSPVLLLLLLLQQQQQQQQHSVHRRLLLLFSCCSAAVLLLS
ncbi:hypothetical protein Emag_000871 [Eimeria magna]